MTLITIDIEPGEAFDRLSILEVKKHFARLEDQNILQDQIEKLAAQINSSITYDLAKKIYCSDEYTILFNANFEVFEGVALAQQNKISGLELDSLNYHRFQSRKKLQEKFFGSPTSEIKLGYK